MGGFFRNVVIPRAAGGGGGGITNVRLSAGTTSNLRSDFTFGNAGGVSFGLDNGTITAVAPAAGGGLTNINVSAGTTSNLLSAFTLNNANGVSFGLDASTITASIATSLTNFRISAGTTSNLLSALTFANGGGVSFGLDASTITATVATSLTNIRLSAGTTSNLASAFTFSNSNGISFGLDAGTITASYTVPTQSNQTLGLYAVGNTTGQSSSSTFDARTVSFVGQGIASVGFSNGSVNISVPAGGGAGLSLGMSTQGNTAGTTGLVSNRYIFVGIGPVSLSQSLNGESGTLSIDAPATSSIVGTNGLSVSTNGNTISVSLRELSVWRKMGQITQAGTAQGNSLVSIQPFILENPVAFSNVLIAGSINVATNTNNSSAFIDVSASAVVYSRNVSTLSSLASFNNTFTQTWTSNATGTVTGVHGFQLTGAATTLTQGEYFIAVCLSTTNTATGGAATTALGNTVSMILSGSIGSAANLVKVNFGNQTATSLGLIGGQGILSTGATRATIAFSAYTMTGTRGFLAPVALELRNQTWWG